jgi:hypothetical protein
VKEFGSDPVQSFPGHGLLNPEANVLLHVVAGFIRCTEARSPAANFGLVVRPEACSGLFAQSSREERGALRSGRAGS